MLRLVGMVLALCLSTPRADAATPADEERADFLVKDGIAAYRKGRFLEAGDRFLAAYQLVKAPVLLKNSAKAYENGGDTATARSIWEHLLAEKIGSDADRADARRHLDALPAPAAPPSSEPRLTQTVRYAPARRPPYVGLLVAGFGVIAVVAGIPLIVAAQNRDEDLGELLAIRNPRGKITGINFPQYEDEQNTINGMHGFGVGLTIGGSITSALGVLLWLFLPEAAPATAAQAPGSLTIAF